MMLVGAHESFRPTGQILSLGTKRPSTSFPTQNAFPYYTRASDVSHFGRACVPNLLTFTPREKKLTLTEPRWNRHMEIKKIADTLRNTKFIKIRNMNMGNLLLEK
jgi:hypothetical protein